MLLMRTCLSWIQPHPHGVILRHFLNMVNSFLCSSINYFENRLLPIDLIVVRNHRDDEDEWDIKRVLERQGDVHIKVEIQSNSKFQSLTLSPTQSPGPPQLQIDVQEAYNIGMGHYTYPRKENEIKFLVAPVPHRIKIGFDQNCQNNFNIQSPIHSGAVHIKTDAQVTYYIQLEHSWPPWKVKEISFLMELVPYPNSSGINGEHRNN
jgi:hypothetical protein